MHPKLQTLLSRLRHRVRRYIVWDSMLAIAAAVLAAFWIAFLIDYLPVRIGGSEMPRSARTVVLIATLAMTAVLLWRFFISRMQRELPDDSLALLIERQHPQFGGRLVTAVQLGETPREGDAHSETFMKEVYEEAEQQVSHVDLSRVFRTEPIRRKLMIVVPLLLAAVVMAVASPNTFARAVGRLTLWSDSPWPRRAALEMVGVEVPIIAATQDEEGMTQMVEFDNGVVRLARGSNASLRIRAAGQDHGHEVPSLCTVSYVDEDGNRGQSNLRRVGRLVDGYQSFVLDGPPLASLAGSVSLTIRGLDDRLSDYRIEAVDPPAIAGMQMRVRYPDYLRVFSIDDNGGQNSEGSPSENFDQQLDYQAGVRIREGSSLTLVGQTSSPVGEVDVVVTGEDFDARLRAEERAAGVEVSPAADPGGVEVMPAKIAPDAMSFSLQLDDVRGATSIRIVPRDNEGISAQAAYRYFIGVVRDEPPETSMKLSGIGSSITPIAILPITAAATDDYGVDEMSITMRVRNQAALDGGAEAIPEPSSTGQIHALSPDLDRQGEAELTMDLRDLVDREMLKPIEPGATVTIGTTARDRFDLDSQHVTEGELIRLQVVTPEVLLATLERRELEFRSRLEQAIDETRRLRQSLTAIEGEATDVLGQIAGGDESSPPAAGQDEPAEAGNPSVTSQQSEIDQDALRDRQRVQLRIRQAGLQASKSTEELAGIVAGLDDLVLEMVNNRIDSVDRRERLQQGVREPLAAVVQEPFPLLGRQIVELERILMSTADSEDDENAEPATVQDMQQAVQQAVATNDEILLQLSAVLEKMLDLESFNEILDLMRGLIDDQKSLLEETEEEQQNRVLDLFQ
ncbi:polyketide synthase [Allorhodopirellula solitaria]|uniref:Polyketide synthase n=1 Tax=Allorhodopirellula solitaria TaxID=2527987 RepID=A0A5C5XY66_9BACT|nr:polyketide synthase [Allorhodopirellula solitaria]TWT67273.1 hypothetical protein CA85_21230 [Allorhodopirellula solitaria]